MTTVLSTPTVRTLDEIHRDRPLALRLPIPSSCTCGGTGECLRCIVDDEAAWQRRADV